MERNAGNNRELTPRTVAPGVGLCSLCTHSRQVVSGKASVFWLCERSRTDPRFRKYPALPVVECVGYESATS